MVSGERKLGCKVRLAGWSITGRDGTVAVTLSTITRVRGHLGQSLEAFLAVTSYANHKRTHLDT